MSFQPTIPPVNFLSQPPGYPKKVSGNRLTVPFMPVTGYQGPQPAQMTANQQHQMHLYAFQQQQLQAQAAAVAARYGQTPQPQGIMPNGTPGNINAAVRSPMVQNTQLAGNAARPSPLSGNTPQTSRSPMPPAQQPGIVTGQHPQQPTTAQQMQSQQMYNYAAANQYNMARMTAMSQNQSLLAAMHQAQHVQQTQQAQAQAQQQAQQQAQTQGQSQQPPQTPQMQAATPEQQQAQAQAQQQAHAHAIQMMSGYPMFNYATQMGMNVPMQGRLPPGYQWPATMGFRRPVNGVGVNGMNVPVNGQAQMQAAHAQQMQRAMQGSVQGR